MIVSHSADPRLQGSPKAAVLLASATQNPEILSHLKFWAPATLLQALQLMSRPEGRQQSVRAYALRSLHICPPEQASLLLWGGPHTCYLICLRAELAKIGPKASIMRSETPFSVQCTPPD